MTNNRNFMLLKIKQQVQKTVTQSAIGLLLSRYFRDQIPHMGCKIFAPPDDVSPKVVAKIFWRFYEKSEVLFVRRYLRSDLDMIELGSSIGVVSSHIGKKLMPGKRLVCVEANLSLISIIKKNISLNAPLVQYNVLHAAIDYSGKNQVALDLGCSNTDSQICVAGNTSLKVSTSTLFQIYREYNMDRFALVCDIEGSEWGIIKNEHEVLKSCQQLIIELHPFQEKGQSISVENMMNILVDEHGFKKQNQRGDVFLFER